jgi:hypothetical protein
MDDRDARENSRREKFRARLSQLPEDEANSESSAEEKRQKAYEKDKELILQARQAARMGSPLAGSAESSSSGSVS